MISEKPSSLETKPKDLIIALSIFTTIIVLSILLAWMFSPSPVIFSETFDNNERNQQYLPCEAFTIVDERLRVTVTEPHSGCAVRLPNEYEDFTFRANVYPVDDVHDGSINILVRQGSKGWYEIQFRPNEQQINFLNFAIDANGNPYVDTSTGWQPVGPTVFRNSVNTIRVTVTEQWLGFWFNDDRLLVITCPEEFPFNHGVISIGIGAGETGGVAFGYDNLEIQEEGNRSFLRWWYDFWTIWNHRNWDGSVTRQEI
jgi:hypothetical protein